MRARRGPRSRGAAAAALLLALTACSGGADPSSAPDAQDPTSTASGTGGSAGPTPTASASAGAKVVLPERPPGGACYRLTVAAAARPTHGGEPVPCSKKHTARTVHVGTLDAVVEGHALAVDSDRVQEQLARTCPARLRSFVGGSREQLRLSRLQVVWFSPTLEEFDAGANWFRCDLIAFGDGDRLLPLPRSGRLRGVLDRPAGLATFGLCGTAQPGSPGFRRVACALDHTWVAIGTLTLPGRDRYPGVATVREAGEEPCSERARSRSDDALEVTYGWEWPTRAQWAAGQHYGYCWAPA